MKYKVGDRVKVREDLKEGMEIKHGVNEAMEIHRGRIVTIEKVFEDYYNIKEDTRYWLWTDEMFEYKISKEDDEFYLWLQLQIEESRYKEHNIEGFNQRRW